MAVLLECARAQLNATAADTAVLGATGIDWPRVIALARRHALLPVLARQVGAKSADGLPEVARSRLKNLEGTNQVRSMVLTEELKRLIAMLEGDEVEVIAYKGPALAQQIYGDVAMRTFVDLDLLVRPDQFSQARAALLHAGYVVQTPLSPLQERVLLRGECDQPLVGRGVLVELHWAVAPPHLSFPLTATELLSRSRFLDLEGTRVRVPSMEDLVLLLAMNGAKDLWRSLEPVVLLAALVRNPGVDWPQLLTRARRLGAQRILALGLWLAADLLGVQPASGVAATSILETSLAGLGAVARAHLLDETPAFGGELRKTIFRCRTRERWSDRLRHCLLRALMPSVQDCAGLPLPPALWTLAAAVRPFRLLGLVLAQGRKTRPR